MDNGLKRTFIMVTIYAKKGNTFFIPNFILDYSFVFQIISSYLKKKKEGGLTVTPPPPPFFFFNPAIYCYSKTIQTRFVKT